MPAFQSPFGAAGKRKHAYDESNLPPNKRTAISYGENGEGASKGPADSYWIVQWCMQFHVDICSGEIEDCFRRNPQYKKHKTWDGDAVLVVRGEWCELQDVENGHRCVHSN